MLSGILNFLLRHTDVGEIMSFLSPEYEAVELHDAGQIEETFAVDVDLHIALVVIDGKVVPAFIDEFS